MKKSTKMSANKVSLETRISARVSNALYIAMRLIASSQSMTMEEKIGELCKKEVAYVSGQKWFIDMIKNGGASDIQPILDLMNKTRKVGDPDDELERQMKIINEQLEPGTKNNSND